MMKLKDLLGIIKVLPQKYPVETVLGATYFVASSLMIERIVDRFWPIFFVFIFFVVTITLRKINKLAYFASYFFVWIIQFALPDFDPFDHAWFWVLNIVAAIVLLVDVKTNDSKIFAELAIFNIEILISAIFYAGIVSAMISAIIGSIMYLFNTEFLKLLAHVNFFIWFLFFPLVYCHLQDSFKFTASVASNFVKIVVDYIVSPALVIYTLVLYVYILKIVVAQELPRGGVAYIVSFYIAFVLIGNLFNKFFEGGHFNWFYNNFIFIVVAPLVLLWVGVVYRIREYGLTESRVYLLIINVLVTLFPLMLKFRPTNRYNLLTIIMIFFMVVFTCIPPISARNIGIQNQYSRFISHAKDLRVFDSTTWTFKEGFDIETIINQDSVLKEKYYKLYDEYIFLCNNTDSIRNKYSLNYYTENVLDDKYEVRSYYLGKHVKKISVGEYDYCLGYDYNCSFNDGIITINNKSDNKNVLKYHIQDSLDVVGKDFSNNPLRVLKYSNDSILIIIESFLFKEKNGCYFITDIFSRDITIFKK